jgi:hypothetical protein
MPNPPNDSAPAKPYNAHFLSISKGMLTAEAWAAVFDQAMEKSHNVPPKALEPVELLVCAEQEAHLGAELLASSRPEAIINHKHIINGALAAKDLAQLYVEHDLATDVGSAREDIVKMLNTSMDGVKPRTFAWNLTPSMLGWNERGEELGVGTLLTCLRKEPAELPPLPATAHNRFVKADVRAIEQEIMDTHGLRTGDACKDRASRRRKANALVDAYMQANLFTDPATPPPCTTTLETARAAALPFIEACGATIGKDHDTKAMPPLDMQILLWPDNPATRSAKANELLAAGRKKPSERGEGNSHGAMQLPSGPARPPGRRALHVHEDKY